MADGIVKIDISFDYSNMKADLQDIRKLVESEAEIMSKALSKIGGDYLNNSSVFEKA